MTRSHTIRRRASAMLRPVIGPPLRRVRYRFAMLLDRFRPASVDGVPIPPKVLRRLSGPQGFLETGRLVAKALVTRAGLGEDDAVLEVGCGSGRVALALLDVVGPDGSYDGIDIVPEAVAWCQRRITPIRPTFAFHLADVHNDHYHRRGSTAAEEYRYPFVGERFDLVFLSSVFTHLGTAPTRRYILEAARVLRPGGRFLATFFLLDEIAAAAMHAVDSRYRFESQADGSFTLDHRDPDAAVAHPFASVTAMLAEGGLELVQAPWWGGWSGREDTVGGFQDLLLAVKPPRREKAR
jgi:SAM-dependent methyltransferase